MSRKPIRIDWDELEAAFENKNEELVYFLDLVTGRVYLEGEGEEDLDESDDLPGRRGGHDRTRLRIETPRQVEVANWAREFARRGEALDGDARDALAASLRSDDFVQAFKNLIRDDLEIQDRWLRYRSECVRDRIEAWIAENGIQLAEPPPWKEEA